MGSRTRAAGLKTDILKLRELRVVAFVQFAKKSEKTVVTLWILNTKNLFFIA